MKLAHFFLIVFIVFGFTRAFAQENPVSADKWSRIETENQELAVSFPKDYLVNIKSSATGDRTSVFAFLNGVAFELHIRKQFSAKDNLGRVNIDQSKKPTVLDYKVNDFYGKSVIYSQKGYENSIFLASKSAYYVIKIKAESKNASEIAYFLRSIKLKGESLFVDKSNLDDAPAETVSTKSFKTSPQVKEALKRKSEKIERKIRFEPLSAFTEPETDYSIRPAIVLTDVGPEPRVFFRGVNKGGELKIKADLLANGQVGDITVYSDIDKSVLRSYAESVKNMKFIPAQKSDGTPVASVQTFWSHFGVSVTTEIITVN